CSNAGAIRHHNDALLFNARPGLLGTSLANADTSRAIVGDPPPDAALAVMDATGIAPVGRDFGAVVSFVVTPAQPRVAVTLLQGIASALDFTKDALLVIGAPQSTDPARLGVAALRAPDVRPGLLRSGFTSRTGVVTILDVAPTVLDLLRLKRPDHMEGRPMTVGSSGGSLEARVRSLRDLNARAQFRDRIATTVLFAFAIGVVALTLAAALLFARVGTRGALQAGAFAVLLFPPLTYLAGLVPFFHWSPVVWWISVVAVVVLGALALALAERRRSGAGVVFALVFIGGSIAVDVLAGSRLQQVSPFGSSPTAGGRYFGLGNTGFALLAMASLLLAELAMHARARWSLIAAGTILGAAIVVDGAPMFGADIGGVLAMVPAYALAVMLLAGRRPTKRTIVWCGLAAVALVGAFTAIDVARPQDRRTHLGRFVTGGWGDAFTTVRRKLSENLAVLRTSIWTLAVPAALVLLWFLVRRVPDAVPYARRHWRVLPAALVLIVLGSALNDSGIGIGAFMLAVLVPVLLLTNLRVEAPSP
ncbi:MAG TPA: hypothetical protein VFR41_15455, partial [Acidimicrobiia bacterium]|nr:hypothetical protein [Acidimicrobiia bacterium]